MIPYDRVEKAVMWIAEHYIELAEAKEAYEYAHWKAKNIRDAIVGRVDGTVAEKEGYCAEDKEYLQAKEYEFACLLEYEKLKNKRQVEEIVINTWGLIPKDVRARDSSFIE